MTANHQEDRSLVRRLNFLGFPEEKRGGLSYAGLKAELGDDNAAKLVTRIEELLIKQGLESLGVPLSSALSRIVQSLTPDERRTMAQEGVVPAHVQTRVSAEIATAKLQQLQTPKNIHAAGLVTDKAPSEKPLGTITNRGGNQFVELSDKSKSASVASTASSNPEFLKTLGLDYGTARTLASLGFSTPEQVRQIANDANTLGLAPKAAAVDIAKLRKAEGKDADQHIKTLGEYGKSYEEIERERLKWEARPDSPERTENLRIQEQKKRELEQRVDKYDGEHVHTPEGKKQFHRLKGMVKDEADLRIKAGLPARRQLHDSEITRANEKNRALSQKTAAVRDSEQSQDEAASALLAAAGMSPTSYKEAQSTRKAEHEKIAKNETPSTPRGNSGQSKALPTPSVS